MAMSGVQRTLKFVKYLPQNGWQPTVLTVDPGGYFEFDDSLEDELDGIADLWVDSLEAIERDWSTDKAKEILQVFFEDEKNFIDWSRSTILVSEELVVIP